MPQRPGDLGPKQKAWCDRHLPIFRNTAYPSAMNPTSDMATDQTGTSQHTAKRDHTTDLHMSSWL